MATCEKAIKDKNEKIKDNNILGISMIYNFFKMIKIGLKDAYFSIPLNDQSKKYVRFQWRQKCISSYAVFVLD